MKFNVVSVVFFSAFSLAVLNAHAAETFTLPTPDQISAMSEADKVKLFNEYQGLPEDKKQEVQKQLQALPSEQAAIIIDEVNRLANPQPSDVENTAIDGERPDHNLPHPNERERSIVMDIVLLFTSLVGFAALLFIAFAITGGKHALQTLTKTLRKKLRHLKFKSKKE
jgi:hypothetical protein